jgi:hypothetical protein
MRQMSSRKYHPDLSTRSRCNRYDKLQFVTIHLAFESIPISLILPLDHLHRDMSDVMLTVRHGPRSALLSPYSHSQPVYSLSESSNVVYLIDLEGGKETIMG